MTHVVTLRGRRLSLGPEKQSGAKERLANAVQRIEQALSRQSDAFKGFQEVLDELDAEVRGLGKSWRRYNTSLKNIDVDRLSRDAGRLSELCDDWIRRGK